MFGLGSLVMKLSVRSFVIVLPIVIALAAAWQAQKQRDYQRWAQRVYHNGVETGRDASPALLFKAFGKTRCAEIMAQQADQSSDIIFDGEDRWVQILRVPNAHGVDRGDGYTLFSLSGDATTWNWTLPKGGVIQAATFDGDDVVFRVFGTVEQGSYRYEIPEEEPDEFRIRWPAGAQVASTDPPRAGLSALMSKRYCVPANHVP